MSFHRSPIGRRGGTLLAGLVTCFVVGCNGSSSILFQGGHFAFPLSVPLPVPQLIGDNIQAHHEKDYRQVPIMPPITEQTPATCLDPPSDYDVMRAMKKPSAWGHVPFIYEKHYNNVQIVKEKLVDSVDECRFYPLVGPAQLHHCHYKVTVYYDRLRHSSFPFAWEVSDKDVEVLYIDKDHLHMCVSPQMEEMPESYKDIYGAY